MSDEDRNEEEKSEEEKAQQESHAATVRAAQKSLGDNTALVSDSVAADPVARNSEPYKSLIEAQGEDIPEDLTDDES